MMFRRAGVFLKRKIGFLSLPFLFFVILDYGFCLILSIEPFRSSGYFFLLSIVSDYSYNFMD